jgi:hypothetical protein
MCPGSWVALQQRTADCSCFTPWLLGGSVEAHDSTAPCCFAERSSSQSASSPGPTRPCWACLAAPRAAWLARPYELHEHAGAWIQARSRLFQAPLPFGHGKALAVSESKRLQWRSSRARGALSTAMRLAQWLAHGPLSFVAFSSIAGVANLFL